MDCIDCSSISNQWLALWVLGIWYYDNLLLKKIQKLINKNAWYITSECICLYHKLRYPNDMIKDGYHVDFVYFVSKNNENKILKYDVLSLFREYLKTHKFNQCKFETFMQYCEETTTQIPKNTEIYLEIQYTFDYKTYKLFYDCNTPITFPIYSEQYIREQQNTDSILVAFLCENEDDENGLEITNEIQQLAGPLGNFYEFTEYKQKRKYITKLNNKLLIKYMDSEGNFKFFE